MIDKLGLRYKTIKNFGIKRAFYTRKDENLTQIKKRKNKLIKKYSFKEWKFIVSNLLLYLRISKITY